MMASPGCRKRRMMRSMSSSEPAPNMMSLIYADVVLDGLPQEGMLRVWINVITSVIAQGGQGSRRRAIGILVAVQLDDTLRRQAQASAQHLEGLDGCVLLHTIDVRAEQVLNVESSHSPYLENRLFVGQVGNLSYACFHALR